MALNAPEPLQCAYGCFVAKKGQAHIRDFHTTVPCGHAIHEVVTEACRMFPDSVLALNYGEFAVWYRTCLQVMTGRRGTNKCRHQKSHHPTHFRLALGMLCVDEQWADAGMQLDGCYYVTRHGRAFGAYLADIQTFVRDGPLCIHSYQIKMRCFRPTHFTMHFLSDPPVRAPLQILLETRVSTNVNMSASA